MDISGALLPAMQQNLKMLENSSAPIKGGMTENTASSTSLALKPDERFSSYTSLLSRGEIDAHNMSPDEFFSINRDMRTINIDRQKNGEIELSDSIGLSNLSASLLVLTHTGKIKMDEKIDMVALAEDLLKGSEEMAKTDTEYASAPQEQSKTLMAVQEYFLGDGLKDYMDYASKVLQENGINIIKEQA
ncbi:hypothetical protein K6Y31_04980 [Motilimonas cestriensis]|uniref:Uncharacterized protein n=1 Tax=Motilimonas cestriensis TaxID=2742685 RepID=A0ABS8W5B6_9GAMM|nr:hypothetical protein [Motilimonas cestriensis]MCE2594164.1 hypothetical protein [Motilimonas cestriensis]